MPKAAMACSCRRPRRSAQTPVDVIVVMSRGFAGEIVAEAKTLAPDARIILYADLLARARLARPLETIMSQQIPSQLALPPDFGMMPRWRKSCVRRRASSAAMP